MNRPSQTPILSFATSLLLASAACTPKIQQGAETKPPIEAGSVADAQSQIKLTTRYQVRTDLARGPFAGKPIDELNPADATLEQRRSLQMLLATMGNRCEVMIHGEPFEIQNAPRFATDPSIFACGPDSCAAPSYVASQTDLLIRYPEGQEGTAKATTDAAFYQACKSQAH